MKQEFIGLKPLIEVVTYISTYGILNGRCAWCGKNAKRLTMKHFEKHEKIDISKKKV